MKPLSLSAINAVAPYHLREAQLGGFDFDVDAGITYKKIRGRFFDPFCRKGSGDRNFHTIKVNLKLITSRKG